MTIREICTQHKPIASVTSVYMASILIHEIEYDIEDAVLFSVENASDHKTSYYRSVIQMDEAGAPYFELESMRIYLDECERL